MKIFHKTYALLLIGLLAINARKANAMEFEIVRKPSFVVQGHVFPESLAIYAKGEIKRGDKEKFDLAIADVLRSKARDQYGNITMYLNGTGGDVKEALRITRVMDVHEFTAIVRSGDVCYSSCASILYISARHHIVHEGGKLGFHTCKEINSQTPFEQCNEIIAKNALFHGTAYQSILDALQGYKFKNNARPTDLIVIDKRESILFGLYGPPVFDPTIVIPPEYCSHPKDESENVVCSNPQLLRYDLSAKKILSILKNTKTYQDFNLDGIMDSFNQNVNSCNADYDCLLFVYSNWKYILKTVYVSNKVKEFIGRYDIKDIDSDDFYMALNLMATIRDEDNSVYKRPLIYERQFEFLMDNVGMTLIDNDLTKRTNYTLDCYFKEFCDSSIRTGNVLNLILHRHWNDNIYN